MSVITDLIDENSALHRRVAELEAGAESLRLTGDHHHEQEIEYRRRWAEVSTALAGLKSAAKTVLDGLNERIDYAVEQRQATPVFEGIAALHSALCAAPVVSAEQQGVAAQVEPTHAMILAGEAQWESSGNESPDCAAIYRAMLAAAPAAPAADAWIPVSERLPDVPDGDEREVIVCVKRAHNGQSYSFSARYLNNFPLHSDSEDEPMIVTGWHDVKEHAEYDGWYSPLIDSSSGDEVTHWMPLPAALPCENRRDWQMHRIMRGVPMTNNTINVPRELLERVLYLMDNYIGTTHTEEDELRALLSAPSPAGVDGLERYDMHESDEDRYFPPLLVVTESSALAIIDGLRGEVEVMTQHANNYSRMFEECAEERDQQAQRIGELEGLLRRTFMFAVKVQPISRRLFNDIDAALSAGKEGE